MSFEADGQVSFDDPTTIFRYRICVWESALTIWLEDRNTKAQWKTVDLKTTDFVVDDNKIPRTDLVAYAQHFSNSVKGEHRSLSIPTKDGSRHLKLVILLHVGELETPLEYYFLLMPVALDRVDILAAQVLDMSEKLKRNQVLESLVEYLTAELEQMRSRVDELEAEREKMGEAIKAAQSCTVPTSWACGWE